ncbi:SCO7613 C-terminal domain-containing membrane protein [Nocardioides alkalitolerans]|uniref:SCO7613 C-terminal domain-containing membrane protein n=1 Tax=Nocardioides alkalitolerans TaxID=281714 RepID=UPI0004208518|nr:hypothetical protein [Nocardioides alkalitolerans]
MLFADPSSCPDCRAPYAGGRTVCPRCGLPLTGDLARTLFSTLQRADELVGALRASVAVPAAPAPAPVPAAAVATAGPAASPEGPAPVWRSTVTSAPRSGMLETGVPKLLLGLGAFCLLVGSLVFLAIAWVLLGVGGRTAVLVAMTTGAGAASYLTARRTLPAAAESFAAVTTGLLLLVVSGARAAGWFGEIELGGVLVVMGVVVAGAGLGGAEVVRRTPVGRLVTGELAVVLGGVLAATGFVALVPSPAAGFVGATLLLGALAVVGSARGLRVLAHGATATAVGAWLLLLGVAAVRAAEHLSFAGLWTEGHVWPLLAAAGLAALPAAAAWLARPLRVSAAAVAGAVAVAAVVLGLHDVSLEAATIGWSLVLLGAAAAAYVVPRDWRGALLGPVLVSAAVPAVLLLTVLAAAAANVTGVRGGSEPDVRLQPALDLDHPWVALVAAVSLTAALVAALDRHVPATRGVRGGVLLLIATGVAVVASYDVPLAVVVGLLAAIGCAGVALATHHRHLTEAWVTGGVALTAAVGAGAPVDALLAGAAIVALGACAAVLLLRVTGLPGTVAAGALPLAVALVVAPFGRLLEHPAHVGLTVTVLLVGLLVVGLPRLPLEVAATGVTTYVVLVTFGSELADPTTAWVEEPLTWVAVQLTVAGLAAAASSVLHPSRRPLGWVGGALLVLASWARLADTGVTTPEAYTLPGALVLLVVGVVALLRDPRRATVPVLTSGLLLALVPSLLIALGEPAGVRSLLVGVASLALVLGGAALRWTAPLVVGGVVGALLLVRALAPYAAQLPPYVVILTAGAALVTVGVTWEGRLRDLRRGQAYVARLR